MASIKSFPTVFAAMMIAIFLNFGTKNIQAAELIMMEQDGCHWCERWNQEIGVMYHKTWEGKSTPLRRIDIYEKLPDDLKDIRIGNYTPTFVIWHEGKEIARLRGYPGEDFFWGLLDIMLEKVPNSSIKTSG